MASQVLRVGMVGMGMIFDETYRPCFEHLHRHGLYDRDFGEVQVELAAVATRTGSRAEAYRQQAPSGMQVFQSATGDDCIHRLLENDVHVVCVATPDDRHFDAALAALRKGSHVLIEKPAVLTLQQLDTLCAVAKERGRLAKVVYHKLLDPDHKKLRTFVADGVLQHVNNGYCTLLEPKSISSHQFAEWIHGRNPGTYVAVHYLKLIDFTFGGKLKTVSATGQRGLVGQAQGPTWDSVQMRLVYEYDSGREAAFDIHTSWVAPDNFPGYVEQEVQFRFDNGIWNGHSRKRGVECTVEGKTPLELKQSINNHYNGRFLEPWNERSQRGYGVEVIERFLREVAHVEFGGPDSERPERCEQMQALDYNDLRADRQVTAAVQALEAILSHAANGRPNGMAMIDGRSSGLTLAWPGDERTEVLYEGAVSSAV